MRRSLLNNIILLFVISVFSACGEEDEPAPIIGCQISEIKQDRGDGRFQVTTFEYDEKRNLLKQTNKTVGQDFLYISWVRTYNYNNTNQIVSIDVSSQQGTIPGSITYEYNVDGTLNKSITYERGNLIFTKVYEYDDLKRVIKETTNYSAPSPELKRVSEDIYEYIGQTKNLERVITIYKGQPESLTVYEDYDDKHNPFGSQQSALNVLGYVISQNHARKSTFVMNSDGEERVSYSSFKYNNQGFLIEAAPLNSSEHKSVFSYIGCE
ncbi:hypothetical protein TH61_05675 [Rufibacter sp. DG15C]|uniref:hypothetical protein n=1 Tax=Rufibacter sp. DG15C TaxID=1379909 RepID=UPI00078D6B09|nr:hypothetical protein [Rufibacter sp. DG15C]AMM50772.1 hypothetical protein TH61_05675 [Rufibacter sp. DG15C]